MCREGIKNLEFEDSMCNSYVYYGQLKYLMNQYNRFNIKNMIDNFLKYLYSKFIKILVAYVFIVFYNILL